MKKILQTLLSTSLLVSLAALETQATSFSDVKSTDWFHTAVTSATERNFFSGYEDGTFLPNKEITGTEIAVVLANAFYPSHLALELANNSGSWYTPYVNTLKTFAQEGSAVWNMDFTQTISREETASLLYDVIQAHLGFSHTMDVALEELGKFSSYEDCAPYTLAVGNILKFGYMSGMSDSSFGGSSPLTRAQSAVIIVNMDDTTLFQKDLGAKELYIEADVPVEKNLLLHEKYPNGSLRVITYPRFCTQTESGFDIFASILGPIYFPSSYIEQLKVGDILSFENASLNAVALSSVNVAETRRYSSKITEISSNYGIYTIYTEANPKTVANVENGLYFWKIEDSYHHGGYDPNGNNNGFDEGDISFDQRTAFVDPNGIYSSMDDFFSRLVEFFGTSPIYLDLQIEGGVVTSISPVFFQ